MRMTVKAVALIALAGLAVPTVASAQDEGMGMEFGADFSFNYVLEDPGGFIFGTPVDFRVGFPIGTSLELEPRLAFSYIKPEGFDGITGIDAILGLLWHFNTDVTRSRIFLRPFAEMVRVSDGTNALTRIGFGGALGIKLPAKEDLDWRLEAGFRMVLEKDNIPSEKQIIALIGVSYRVH